MAKKNMIGAWAFLVGVVLAAIVGLFGLTDPGYATALVILGVVVGLLNVGGAELKDFMIAGAVLVVVSSLATGTAVLGLTIGSVDLGAVFQALVTLFAPATVVVALKSVFAVANR